MSRLTIHTERLAIRCDLCHQNDLFDPNTNNCLRCSGIVFGDEPKKEASRVSGVRYKLTSQAVITNRMTVPVVNSQQEQQRPFRRLEVNHNPTTQMQVFSGTPTQYGNYNYVSLNSSNCYFPATIRVYQKRNSNTVLFWVVVLLGIAYFIKCYGA